MFADRPGEMRRLRRKKKKLIEKILRREKLKNKKKFKGTLLDTTPLLPKRRSAKSEGKGKLTKDLDWWRLAPGTRVL